ncbi:MAG: dephospho-CoA kinase [Elainellaceae cyanobacterium]
MRFDSKAQPQKTSPHRRIIGITGGIGMGKTTVSSYLVTAHALSVLDADVIARDVVAPGSSVLQKIVDRYGKTLLLPDGHLDRVRLGEIVFNSPPERRWIERQIHPHVRECLEQELSSLKLQSEPIVILVVPLLFEARMTDLATEIWVVYCDFDKQVERLLQRKASAASGQQYQLQQNQVMARIKSQMPIEQKLRRADIVLDNSSEIEHLYRQIDHALMQPPHPVGENISHHSHLN